MRPGALLMAALVAGCVSFGPREADRYFVLEAASPPGATAPAPPRHGVSVAPTTASSFYDTQSMAYSRAAGTRAYYQFNHWTERPQRVIHARLASRLEGDGTKGTLVLHTHLEEIYHDAAAPPGIARIAIRAELADARSGRVIARREFTASAPASTYDANGAVHGFDRALGAVIDDIVAWVDERAAP